ncbi:MAG: DUF6152 family protein [Gammaproteobacteria bacterium]
MRTQSFGLLAASALIATSAEAHHSFGTFLMNENIELKGVVTKLDYVNPHSWLHFTATGPDGKAAEYKCEMRSATTLRRSGWTLEMFTPGTGVTVQGSPDRVDPHSCYVSTLVLADGTQLDRYGQRIAANAAAPRAARLPSGEPNLAGDWAQEQLVMTDSKGLNGTLVPLSQVGKYAPGGVPEGQREIPGARGTAEANAGGLPLSRPAPRSAIELTAAGKTEMEKLAAVSRAQRSCMQGSIVSDWGGEPVNRITQSGDTIKLQYGRLGLERTIYMNVAAHPANITRSRAGHSTGKWDNDVLVVDTVGFLPGTLTGVTPNSDKLHVVERFTLDPTTMMLKREYTADDPVYLTAQYKGSDTVAPSNVPYAAEACEDLTPTGPSTAGR